MTSRLDALAAWSPWMPISIAAREATDRPGVYVGRLGESGPIIYVGMAGERRGKGVRGRLRVYATGRAIHSGLGKAVLDRALADSAFLHERIAEVERGEARTAQEWGIAALRRFDLYVCWAQCTDRRVALNLERRTIAVCERAELWNLRT